jgi:hypothetical protein
MMRLTMAIWWSLALLWLATSQAGAEPAPQAPPRRQEIKGYGPTHAVAKQDALREAAQQLAKHLRKMEPPLTHWEPSESFVQQHLFDGPGKPDQDAVFEKAGVMKTWVVTLKLPHDTVLVDWDRQAQREARAEERLSQALHVVAALFIMLTVSVGYVRLDDWTRSRYTPWLRAGARTRSGRVVVVDLTISPCSPPQGSSTYPSLVIDEPSGAAT